MKKISFVLPVKDEVSNVEPLAEEIFKETDNLAYDVELHFICDPSSDGTERILESMACDDFRIKVTFTADRVGQAESIRIGYESSNADAVITMDSDFQDPPSVIPLMIEEWEKGNLIVHSKRTNRKSDNLIYRSLMGFGYRILSQLTDGKVQLHVGDFRLVDKKIVEMYRLFGDPRPFWRAISNLDGIESTLIEYKRPPRKSGKTKYSALIGSPAFALRGMAAFSIRPLQWLQGLGFLSATLSVLTLLLVLFSALHSGTYPRGVPTIITIISLFFFIQFVATAIVATYLIVIVEQTRRRPNYLIKDNFRPNTSA